MLGPKQYANENYIQMVIHTFFFYFSMPVGRKLKSETFRNNFVLLDCLRLFRVTATQK